MGLLLIAVVLPSGFGPEPLAAAERFTENADGTVNDHLLNLMWAKDHNQGDITWKDADRYCRVGPPHLIGRYADWRMPTLAELESLYWDDPGYPGDETACGQRVKALSAIRLSCGWAWSSEQRSISARVYNCNRGYSFTDRRSEKRHYRAQPVRDLAPEP